MPEDAKATGTGAPAPTRLVDQGKRQFIIAPRRGSQALGAGIRPMSAPAMRALIGQIAGLEVVRVLRPRRGVSAVSVTPDEATEIYVARVDPDHAELIRQTLPPQLVVEEDALLEYAMPAGIVHPVPTRLASWSFAGAVETRPIRFRVIGESEKPLANVGVSLTGEGFPQEGRTDKRGEVTVPLIALPGKRARSVYASSPSNYWDHYVIEPELVDGDVNVVRLRPMEETLSGFPEHYRYGWGQLQMGLDRVPETLGGKGVKIAIVDSGVDTSHTLLRHVRHGVDLTNPADPQAWTHDIVGHGTHAAGIVAARDESGKMLRGFVPDAEIHVLKVFPGGRLSNALEALDYCLELEIDVVNLSLGTPQPSQAIGQKLEEAVFHGIACIVAAGSSGARVQYPASSPHTMAVGAVGRLNEYPGATWEATTVQPHLIAPDGIFAPSFSCTGPELAVCAPGVAIVSTVPGGFEPQSGTSTAAPHVTGLAALLLAHHPLFQGPLRARSQQRVAALFGMIRWLAVPYGFGAERTGAGLPRLDAVEHVLQPSLQQMTRGNGGNGQSVRYASPPAGVPGVSYGQYLGGAPGTMTGPLSSPIDPAQLAPLYVQSTLVGQAWPVQALIESMRRQYLGN